MRDAFGGTFMIKLFLVFIFIYVAVGAIALNYAKAFKVKNQLVDFIETNEISDIYAFLSKGDDSGRAKINSILENAQYNAQCLDSSGESFPVETVDGVCYRGVLFSCQSEEKTAAKYTYCKVTTTVSFNLGIINNILSVFGKSNDSSLSGQWRVSGESRIVVSSN